jgi:S-DNA-T family DNA segregation ATPase FtsK/SpoIIIE
MDTQKLIAAEINLINRLLGAHGVQARTTLGRTLIAKSSFIAYGLQFAPGETVRKVEAIDRELSNELTRQRVRLLRGYNGRAVVRLRDYPLAIEVPHPAPVPLSWESACMRMGQHVALVGRSYDYGGAREEYLDLDRHYHTLVSAMSGGGKSTMMRMALLTLALNTSPADLRIMLIDLKNDDLTPFRALPHVVSYAGDTEAAAKIIAQVHAIKTERIETQTKPYRLLLVIDELAELGPDREALRQLGSILSTGRSLGINVWAGTQYPTAATIGSVVNASFTVRLVGMVDGKQAAHTASKRAGSGAELLQLPGDFLRVDGAELRRMKAYNIDQDETARLVAEVGRRKKKPVTSPVTSPVITGYDAGYDEPTTSEDEAIAITGYHNRFPLRQGRPLSEAEGQTVRRMAEAGEFDHRGALSVNRAVAFVYGSKSPERITWVREALQQVAIGD